MGGEAVKADFKARGTYLGYARKAQARADAARPGSLSRWFWEHRARTNRAIAEEYRRGLR